MDIKKKTSIIFQAGSWLNYRFPAIGYDCRNTYIRFTSDKTGLYETYSFAKIGKGEQWKQ